MKRTVKAWVIVTNTTGKIEDVIYSTERAADCVRSYWHESSRPCTITYDDGCKPKRRKK